VKKGKSYWGNYALFVGPLLLSFLVFFLLPIILGIGYSFYDWNGISKEKTFVGLKNYIIAFTNDPNYWATLKFTLKYVFFNVVFTNIFAMLLALWVTSGIKCGTFLRASFFMPNLLGGIIIGLIWRFIFNQIMPSLGNLTGLSFLKTKILAGTDTAWIAVVIASLWTSIGYNMIIYIAGLVSIDKNYYEAALVDGATKPEIFFKITLPLMMPAITITLFNTISSSFKMYELCTSLTGGGPAHSTTSMAASIFDNAFTSKRMGYGQAQGVILLVIVIAVSLIQTAITRRKEVEM